MSRAYGLVKFKRTGNIYYCCYNGTSDVLQPVIFTPEECYDEKLDCYCAITYAEEELERRPDAWRFPEQVEDLDDVEIYSSYGGGFYWRGSGSESLRLIKEHLAPFDDFYLNEIDIELKDGQPDWIKEFLEYL